MNWQLNYSLTETCLYKDQNNLIMGLKLKAVFQYLRFPRNYKRLNN